MNFPKFTLLVLITFIPILTIGQITADVTTGCHPLTINFSSNVAGAATWQWDFMDNSPFVTGNGTPIHTFFQPGVYNVKLVTDIKTDSILITVRQTPNALFDTTTIHYASFTILCTDTSTFQTLGYYIWKFENEQVADTNKLSVYSHKYPSEMIDNIELVVVDQNGCSDSISKPVNVKHQFRIPNIFTPNGDGMNDSFMVLANGYDIFPKAVIYNRWGNVIYKIENVAQIIWDGRTFDGRLVAPGTYFYVITPPVNSNYQYIDSDLKGSIQVFYN